MVSSSSKDEKEPFSLAYNLWTIHSNTFWTNDNFYYTQKRTSRSFQNLDKTISPEVIASRKVSIFKLCDKITLLHCTVSPPNCVLSHWALFSRKLLFTFYPQRSLNVAAIANKPIYEVKKKSEGGVICPFPQTRTNLFTPLILYWLFIFVNLIILQLVTEDTHCIKTSYVTGRPVIHDRVFLVPSKTWLVKCTLMYSSLH